MNDYLKNFGPPIGLAFSPDPKTVFRGSYAVIYTHGNNVGGSLLRCASVDHPKLLPDKSFSGQHKRL